MALAHTHLIHANAAHVAKIRLGISSVHLPEKHPPQSGVCLAHYLGHFTHGHLAHEQQGEGFKLLGKVRAQTLPRRTHAADMALLAALATWQPTGDLAAILRDVEMPPS